MENRIDWADYFYECGVIGWSAFKKFFKFNGRASRREFWSLALIMAVVALCSWKQLNGVIVIFFFPMLSAGIRRVHDIGRCGWWAVCPIACFFLFLKKSDDGVNQYGEPYTASDILNHSKNECRDKLSMPQVKVGKVNKKPIIILIIIAILGFSGHIAYSYLKNPNHRTERTYVKKALRKMVAPFR